MSTTDTPVPTSRFDVGRLWKLGLAATAVAAIANVIVWAITDAVMDQPVAVTMNGTTTTISAAQPIFATVLAGVVGILLTWLIARLAGARAAAIIGIGAGAIALLSIAAPLSADTATGVKVSLALMHIVAGVVIIPALVAGVRRR